MLSRGGSDLLSLPKHKLLFSAPCFDWDGDGSSSLVTPLPRGSLCCPRSQLHASHLGGRRAEKEERFFWFLILENTAHSERHLSEYTQDK